MADIHHQLTLLQRLSYSVGHVLNDLCASMWFSYLLVYFHYVLSFSNGLSGQIMLLGQVADALATPFVGIESDKIVGCRGYGKRKSWHLFGTVCVAASFSFLFMQCLPCSGPTDDWVQFIYYAPLVVIFQFGWASIQISHLSLIPELTPNSSERLNLGAIRNAFTVISNLTVYGVAWLLFARDQLHKDDGSVNPDDAKKFMILALGSVGVGLVFSILFHVGTKERSNVSVPQGDDVNIQVSVNAISERRMGVIDWLKEPQFYQVGLLYMCTRLVVNLSQVYLPFFITDSLNMHKTFIAIVPLVVYVSNFVNSLLMKRVNVKFGRKVTYMVGAILCLGAYAWVFWLTTNNQFQVFGPAVLLGFGCSTILITSLGITADLIGHHTESGAFVYGAMSFTDKLANGVAIAVIQYLHPCGGEVCCDACQWFYRDVLAMVPATCAVVALFALLSLAFVTIGNLRKFRAVFPHLPAPQISAEEPSEHAPLLGGRSISVTHSSIVG